MSKKALIWRKLLWDSIFERCRTSLNIKAY